MLQDNVVIEFWDFLFYAHLQYRIMCLNIFKLSEGSAKDATARSNMVFVFRFLCGMSTVWFLFSTPFVAATSLNDLTQLLTYVFFALCCLNKFLSTCWRYKALRQLTADLHAIYPMGVCQQHEFDVARYRDELNGYLSKLHYFHWTAALMFIIFPIVQSTFEVIVYGGEFTYRLPYAIAYPFDVTHIAGYLYAYVQQFDSGTLCSSLMLSTDMLAVGVLQLIIMQFDHLTFCLRTFKTHSGDEDQAFLVVIIKRHKCILHFIEVLESTFSFSNLMTFLLWTLILCLIGVQVVIGTNALDSCKYSAFLVASFTDVYIVCSWGSRLIHSGEEFKAALADHEWFEADLKYQRLVLFAAMRAQVPIRLTALNFFTIDIEAFNAVLKNSYQFFTLLRSQFDSHH